MLFFDFLSFLPYVQQATDGCLVDGAQQNALTGTLELSFVVLSH